jgi:hypothetical protein
MGDTDRFSRINNIQKWVRRLKIVNYLLIMASILLFMYVEVQKNPPHPVVTLLLTVAIINFICGIIIHKDKS